MDLSADKISQVSPLRAFKCLPIASFPPFISVFSNIHWIIARSTAAEEGNRLTTAIHGTKYVNGIVELKVTKSTKNREITTLQLFSVNASVHLIILLDFSIIQHTPDHNSVSSGRCCKE